ncbi:hypothetical protein [Allosalinactinospora lopnorensis]|uniref:hypothetical protein n=1 Tax=Allosalinactinospora lopnorensis TaxID=1352348 RepID=UPI001F2151EE|nr:hypothetical protein [Allosalinactinospora lopnorensis]
MEGRAGIVTEKTVLEYLLALINAKYRTSYAMEFLDPGLNSTVRVRPSRVIALDLDDFEGSPTRWTFDPA